MNREEIFIWSELNSARTPFPLLLPFHDFTPQLYKEYLALVVIIETLLWFYKLSRELKKIC